MSEKRTDKAYDHRSTIPGTADPDEKSIEHRDTALGNAGERNELTPDQRNRDDVTGPRTHPDTRITRKDGD